MAEKRHDTVGEEVPGSRKELARTNLESWLSDPDAVSRPGEEDRQILLTEGRMTLTKLWPSRSLKVIAQADMRHPATEIIAGFVRSEMPSQAFVPGLIPEYARLIGDHRAMLSAWTEACESGERDPLAHEVPAPGGVKPEKAMDIQLLAQSHGLLKKDLEMDESDRAKWRSMVRDLEVFEEKYYGTSLQEQRIDFYSRIQDLVLDHGPTTRRAKKDAVITDSAWNGVGVTLFGDFAKAYNAMRLELKGNRSRKRELRGSPFEWGVRLGKRVRLPNTYSPDGAIQCYEALAVKESLPFAFLETLDAPESSGGSPKRKRRPTLTARATEREGPVIDEEAFPVDGVALAERFGIKNINYGEYMTQGDREQAIRRSQSAFADLAFLTGLPYAAIGRNELSMGYGSRGRGGTARATYEDAHAVINLTKKGGAGALGHEWFHSVDYAISRSLGLSSGVAFTDFVSGNSIMDPWNLPAPNQDAETIAPLLAAGLLLCGRIHFDVDEGDPAALDRHAATMDALVEAFDAEPPVFETEAGETWFRALLEAWRGMPASDRSVFLRGMQTPDFNEGFSLLARIESVERGAFNTRNEDLRLVYEETYSRFTRFLGDDLSGRVRNILFDHSAGKSDFHLEARKLNPVKRKKGDDAFYWTSTREMAARGFEASLTRIADRHGMVSPYLSDARSRYYTDNSDGLPYPEPDEVDALAPLYGNLIEQAASIGLFPKPVRRFHGVDETPAVYSSGPEPIETSDLSFNAESEEHHYPVNEEEDEAIEQMEMSF